MTGTSDDATRPRPLDTASSLKRWARLAAAIPDAADIVLVGDSLAAGWPDEPLRAAFPRDRVFNFGLPSDRIGHTLWRLGEVDLSRLAPRHGILVLGTNDLGDGTSAMSIAAGIGAALARLRVLWPASGLALVAVPPRGPPPGWREADRRELNRITAATAAAEGRTLVLSPDALLAEHELAPAEILHADLLHLAPEGYRLLTAGLARLVSTGSGRVGPASRAFDLGTELS